MPRQRKSKTTATNGKLDDRYVRWAQEGSHPSQVSGMFKDDPTFAEFRDILRTQREEDYRGASEAIPAIIRKEGGAKRCSSSTSTPSRMTKTRTQPSVRK